MQVSLPWFRVHIVILNDPGRLISSHIMHTALVAGWSALMLLYELITIDPTDPVYNPIWRQAAYTLPFISRIGIIRSLFSWALGIDPTSNLIWTYETINTAHILLSGLLILAAFWHWAYWDLDVFFTSILRLDLNQILSIHLTLASSLCLGFGLAHLSGFLGPGMWTSDSLNLVGSIRFVKATFNLQAHTRLAYGVISSHHIIAGLLGISIGLWHITSRPASFLYNLLSMGKLESILSSSITAVFFTAFLISALMWYGSAHSTQELFGPTRYSWDNGYYSLDTKIVLRAWKTLPDKLVLYDYIGSNPAKGGLFRSGPMLKGSGIVQNWLGHASFSMGTLSLSIRRMPAFFESFPVILIDQRSTLRADIAFRRSTCTYSMEESEIEVYFSGGCLNGTEYSTPSLVKAYARKAQFGQIFTFDKKTSRLVDGVFRTSARGWYSFSHIALALCFFFGHLWHATRAIFQDIWTGVRFESQAKQEYGRNEKLGDKTSSTKATVI